RGECPLRLPLGSRSTGLAVKRARARAREGGRYPHDFVNVSDHLGSIRRVGCRTINHWQLGARKPYGVRLFGVFALVQVGFKFPFGERRIGEFGGKDLLAWPQRRALDSLDQGVERCGIGGKLRPPPSLIGNAPPPA